MTFIIIDNTKNLENAEMTPLLINYFKKKKINIRVISEGEQLFKNCENGKNDIVGIILSGGPIILSEKTHLFRYSKNFTALIEGYDIPILGICFGFQVMGVAYGGLVNGLDDRKRDHIVEKIRIIDSINSILFKNLDKTIEVFQAHNDHLTKCPMNFTITSISDDGVIQSIECLKRLRFGVQFHPENSEDGLKILENFTNFCISRKSVQNCKY